MQGKWQTGCWVFYSDLYVSSTCSIWAVKLHWLDNFLLYCHFLCSVSSVMFQVFFVLVEIITSFLFITIYPWLTGWYTFCFHAINTSFSLLLDWILEPFRQLYVCFSFYKFISYGFVKRFHLYFTIENSFPVK
jgi:hypothetical protein